ncbi:MULTISPECIES: aminotransferase class V-fold PLP-dependent enzyme [Bacillus]|uniref:aminotransferase class V-fold PLP-dependent enzyme n=1 Tax=Bacillus TaxID=1386 RepID=UPI000BB78AD4|nr:MULTISPECIES: aminotransferase class V-fold PLP-dependent enzyme [Bacillus]
MIRAKIGSNIYWYDGQLERYFDKFREGIVGIHHHYETPYGRKKMIYADWTASGRLYEPIEKKITYTFGPNMANTHTESNVSGTFMTEAYEEARKTIKQHVHADDGDVLILDGFGMTGVMNKLQRLLGLRIPEGWREKVDIPNDEKPVVFISHMEHHSNHTTWLETIADVIIVPPTKDGQMDTEFLIKKLKGKYKSRKWKIGAFTACSNVTGIVTPYHNLAKIMHEHGGICIVDFAASAPYVEINMHPKDPMEKLDAIVFSPHKLLGGPGSSGVLVFDSKLCKNIAPDHPGGGTVKWTNPWGKHIYVDDIERKEDGGTPGILQAIRAALSIKLKEEMGVENIRKRENELIAILLNSLKKIKGVQILEEGHKDRLGIVSFVMEEIHYNLVIQLLNDRFGFQVRGGCSCAGTYGHYLLNIDQKSSEEIAYYVLEKEDLSKKPGWVRFSIHPTMKNEEIHYFVHAIKQIATYHKEWAQDYWYDKKRNLFIFKERFHQDVATEFTLP